VGAQQGHVKGQATGQAEGKQKEKVQIMQNSACNPDLPMLDNHCSQVLVMGIPRPLLGNDPASCFSLTCSLAPIFSCYLRVPRS
jgi:hypothetical protein